jgi:hypothetical protein
MSCSLRRPTGMLREGRRLERVRCRKELEVKQKNRTTQLSATPASMSLRGARGFAEAVS